MKSPKSKAAKSSGKSLHRHWSGRLVDAAERAQSRAMLHAVGFERGDFQKSQIGVASTWSQVTPCNIHIDKLAIAAAEGVAKAGGTAAHL
ncbi:MAG: dihydroxy-acid dehydratase [Verrucomicrobiota bacterium]